MTLRTDALKKLSISIIDFKSFKRKFELTLVGLQRLIEPPLLGGIFIMFIQ